MDKIDASGLDIDYINRFVGHDAQLVHETNGRRRLVAERFPLGRGGLALIYRAYNLDTQEEVALKIPLLEPRIEDKNVAKENPEDSYQQRARSLNSDTLINPGSSEDVRERFKRTAMTFREGEVQRNINHPNILPVIDVTWGIPPGADPNKRGPVPILVLPLRDPKQWDSMDMKLYSEGNFSLQEAYNCFSQIAKGVDYLADLRPPIYHRDLKPANFLIRKSDGKAQIIDFNISSGAHKIDPEFITGSPEYSNPEAITNSDLIDSRSETFSLAIGLFESITGENPFIVGQQTVRKLLVKIATSDYNLTGLDQFDPETKNRLEIFFKKAFHQKKNERFQYATEMMKEFKKIVALKSSNPIL